MKSPTTSKRALVYTRSATRPNAVSINEQLLACDAYARRHGLTVVGYYQDYGSGLRIGEGLQALGLALHRGEGEAVLVRDRDRLSRDALTAALWEQSAAALGVTIIAIDEDQDDEKR